MIVSGEILVPAPRKVVFEALQNAPFFASCVEGVHELKEIDATHYDAVLETKVAYMKFTFKVSVEVTKIAPPDRIEAKIEGTPLGVVGRFTAVSATDLVEAGAETLVRYAIDANVTGKLGSMGQPVLKSKAREMEKKFAERIRAAFALPAAPRPSLPGGEDRSGGSGGLGATVPQRTTPDPSPQGGGEQNGSRAAP
jgi:uncharacterized protein